MGGKNFSILEVNPVARIDASDYGVDVPFSNCFLGQRQVDESSILSVRRDFRFLACDIVYGLCSS